MSEKLPSLTPKKVIRVFEQAGFVVWRQRGSHVVMVNEYLNKQLIIPFHRKDIKKGLLSALIKQAGLSIQEFKALI